MARTAPAANLPLQYIGDRTPQGNRPRKAVLTRAEAHAGRDSPPIQSDAVFPPLPLRHELEHEAVQLAVEGKGRLVIFVVHAGPRVGPHIEGLACLERKRDGVRKCPFARLDPID